MSAEEQPPLHSRHELQARASFGADCAEATLFNQGFCVDFQFIKTIASTSNLPSVMSEVTVVSKDTVDGQSHDEGRIADFKALYYQINAKPDTDLKVFKEHRIVERNDII